FADLLDEIARAAIRAGGRHHAIPAREFALGIAIAAEEELAAAAAAFQDLAFLAIRTGDARFDRLRLQALDPVAIGVRRAAQEFTEARAAPDHRTAALVAALVGRHRRARFLEHDLTLFVATELRGVGAFRIIGAGEELAVAAPLDNHHAAALIALELGRQPLALDLGHLFLRFTEAFFEWPVKAFEGLGPVLATLLDAVELLFHRGRKAGLEDIRKRHHQQIAYHPPERSRPQALAVVLFDVFTVQDTGHDGGIR